MFVKIFLRDTLVCIADFVGMTMLALCFVLPLPICSLTVCFPTLLAAVLKIFLRLTTYAIPGAANSDKSPLICFAAGTIFYAK